MGSGIAQVLAAAGGEVAVFDANPEYARARLHELRRSAREHEDHGLVSRGTAERVKTNIRSSTSVADALSKADLVIEAVPERLNIKTAVWAEIEVHAAEDALLTTNTSSIPIADVARSLSRPYRLVGMHWFYPAVFVPGLEVIPGPATPSSLVARVVEVAARAGKTPTVVKDSPGFVANRLQLALFREAVAIVEDGVAGPEELDAIVRTTIGFRLPFFGPFAMADMAGLDVYRGIFDVLESQLGPGFSAPSLLIEAVDRGDLGAKTGNGLLALDAQGIAKRAASRDASYSALGRLVGRLSQG
jgi:3-hydroxybutyryl-CoA dehydrogenase